MAQNVAIENVNNQVVNANEVKPFNINEDMEQVDTVMKQQAIEEARRKLAEKKQILADNADAEANIKRSAETNVRKAEKEYLEALKNV